MRPFFTIVAWLGPYSWVVGSIYFAWTNNSDFFQRMGSWGVAVFVLYFAIVRRSFDFEIAEPIAQHDIEQDRLNAEQFNKFGQWMHLLFERISFLATVLKQDLENGRKDVPQKVTEIALLYKDEKIVRNDAIDWTSADMKQRGIATDRISASEVLENLKGDEKNRDRVQNILEVSALFLSTLQWGFGDLWVKNVWELNNALH